MKTTIESLGPEARYLAFLAEGRFMIQRCRASGRHVFPPRIAEPGTGDTGLDWVEPSGLGRVYSTTTIHPRPPAEPFAVSLVELDEGPRLLSRLVGVEPEAIAIGQRVAVFVERGGDEPILLFRPVADGGRG